MVHDSKVSSGMEADSYSLSPMQQGMLYHALAGVGRGVDVEQVICEHREEVNPACFQEAWRQLLRRHAILRTSFHWAVGTPKQVVHSAAELVLPVDYEEYTGDRDARLRVETHLAEARHTGFDPRVAPLLRVALFRAGPSHFWSTATFHHLILDARSMAVVFRELWEIHDALAAGRAPVRPPVGLFRDYIRWLENLDLNSAERFWREYLRGFSARPVVSLPAPPSLPFQAAPQGELALRVGEKTTTRWRALCAKMDVRLNTLMQAAWALVVSRYSGEHDVVFGAVRAGRRLPVERVDGIAGVFINTVPVRTRVDSEKTVARWLQELREQWVDIRPYEHTPLLKIQQWSEVPAGEPLFETLLNYQEPSWDGELARLGGSWASRCFEVRAQSNYPLVIDAAGDAALTIKILFDQARYSAAAVAAMLGHFRCALEGLVENVGARLADVCLLSPLERRQILVEWNYTARSCGGLPLVHEQVENQARSCPRAPALTDGATSISYAELNERANQLAHHLAARGVTAETVVAVWMERSVEMIISWLAVLKAGGAFLPLDPSSPPERLTFQLQDSGALLLVTQPSLRCRFPSFRPALQVVEAAPGGLGFEAESSHNPDRRIERSSLAYLIYTSGSTGQPKAVEIEHAALLNLVTWHREQYAVTPLDRATQLANPAFDAAVWETWPYLTAGAALCIPDAATAQTPPRLVRWLEESGITICFLPTPLAEAAMAEAWPAAGPVRAVLTGGDKLRRRPHRGFPAAVFNHYGPTENTVVATSCAVPAADEGAAPPIGRPIANTRAYVLDTHGQPAPVGVTGELYLGGDGLARGYRNRPAQTGERFVRDPFHRGEGEGRLYRTGDLARWRPNGELEFVGRSDGQVKIRGHRIEPGEVEAALQRHPSVRECVVVAQPDARGEPQLVAYGLRRPGGTAEPDVREFLLACFPAFMVPAQFVWLESWPVTRNGKVDRRALTSLRRTEVRTDGFAAPQAGTEQRVAAIWAEALGRGAIGRNDNFFALGGHSLLAAQTVTRLNALLGATVSVRTLLDFPILAEFAEQIDGQTRIKPAAPVEGENPPRHSSNNPKTMETKDSAARLEPLTPVAGRVDPKPSETALVPERPIPASSGQRRLWFLAQMEPGSPLYNIPYLVRLTGIVDENALVRSLRKMVERHEALRTNFLTVGSEPIQVVAETWSLEMPVTDLSGLERDQREPELARLTRQDATQTFDLESGLKLRARLYRLGANEHALMLVMHHIAADGWSMAVLYRELGACYEAYAQGMEPRLPSLPIQFADYADWQHEYLQGETLERLVEHWRERMAGAPALLELPTDYPRPPVQSHRGDTVQICLSPELVAKLKLLASQQRVTLFMTLLAGLKTVLFRYSGQTDLVIGTPLAGRDAAETEGLVGYFINNVLMRTRLSADLTVLDLLQRVREVALTAFEYRQMPYEKLVEELQPQRSLSFDPLCQVFFALQNMPTAPLKLSGLKLSIAPVYTGTAKADLTIWGIEDESGSLSITAEYATDLFKSETIARLLGGLHTALSAMVTNPGQKIGALPLLAGPERRMMLEEWNATKKEYDARCVHQLFEAQVARTPAASALVFGDESLTYQELNTRSEALARRLRQHHVGPDVLVALAVERSLDMVVGLLGILKAGGAYVPVDPAYPAERIAFMLEDSQAAVLLTQTSLLATLPPTSAAVICLDVPAPRAGFDAHPETTPIRAEHLAYVLYTSGSTGKPKGVMVTHHNVANFFAGMDAVLGTEPGVWLAITSISFDISVLELLWTLARGFKVVILPEAAKVPGFVAARRATGPRKSLDFSLFYFASEGDEAGGRDRYKLLLEGARFADTHGFKAVWTPERHFHSFGGLYPNPAVVGAAIATITERVQIRAGSVVTPLHHPARIAEEWSVVDNLSGGRVGISVAHGWHDRDFVLQPGNYAQRREQMRKDIAAIRQFWRGEAVEFTGGLGNQVPVRIFPRPVQPDLPLWITAAGNPETFTLAGEAGAGVLTHLLGQDLEELARKMVLYREARRSAGHPGEGCVSIALHTFVGHDLGAVKEKVREPMMRYLADSADLMKGLSQAMYPGCEMKNLTNEETRALVEFSFNRYFEVCGLLGTPETCRKILGKLSQLGIDEVACLIDFGVDTDSTLESLKILDGVRVEFQRPSQATPDSSGPTISLAGQIAQHSVTHLQCTPSFARMLLQSPETRAALKPLQTLLVGGEALPAGLADQLLGEVSGSVINMYGPTETTVWSTYSVVAAESRPTGAANIGRPLANTQVYLLEPGGEPAPIGVPAELWIGGDGVARGYWRRPDLTREKFVADPFMKGNRLYRTGDLARYRPDGVIEFLGRVDQQVKIRGHRIELGEIEAALMQHSAVRLAVASLWSDHSEDTRLVAYFNPADGEAPSANALRDFLRQKLPEHMIPAHYVALDKFPLTPNGKIDRKALPAPTGNALKASGEFIAPDGNLEQAVAAIWKDILRVEQIGADDNFFDFGGHSLQVVQVQNRLRESLQKDVPVLKLFQHPTVRTLARFIGEQQSAQASTDGFRQKMEERTRRRQGVIARRRSALVEERA